MKKGLSIVLVLCISLFSCCLTAFAAEADTPISIASDNLGRGAGDSTVIQNDDGSISTSSANISFYLPSAVQADEEVTFHVTGSSDGDFRIWLIDEQEVTNSDIYQMSEHDFTSGDFDITITLTATAEATEIFFKAPAWDAPIDNLTVATLSSSLPAAEADDTDEETEDVADEETEDVADEETELPKTGESNNAIIYLALASVAVAGIVVVSKKKFVKE